jgi:hypothetical protein
MYRRLASQSCGSGYRAAGAAFGDSCTDGSGLSQTVTKGFSTGLRRRGALRTENTERPSTHSRLLAPWRANSDVAPGGLAASVMDEVNADASGRDCRKKRARTHLSSPCSTAPSWSRVSHRKLFAMRNLTLWGHEYQVMGSLMMMKSHPLGWTTINRISSRRSSGTSCSRPS